MSIESVILSNRLILCHSLLLLPSIFPSMKVFSSESVLDIRSPKYWRFSFRTSPSNKYSGLISFRIDWFDLYAVQGTQESSVAPQFERINSSVLSLLYSPIFTSVHARKNRNFDYTDHGWQSLMSLLFNRLSRFISAFLPRSYRLLISCQQSLSVVILEPKKIKSVLLPLFPLLFSMKGWDQMP